MAAAVALAMTACSSAESPSSGLPDFSDIARDAGPSVVNIATVSRGNGDAESGELPFGLEESPFGDWFRDRFGGEGSEREANGRGGPHRGLG